MSKDTQFLNHVYQNAAMGTETLSQLIRITNDIPFRRSLETQLTEYQGVVDQAEKQLQARHQKPEGLSGYAKASSTVMLKMNTLADKTPSHMAEMVIQGSNMGVIEITKEMKHAEVDEDERRLAEKLLKTEQNNIDEMKKYL